MRRLSTLPQRPPSAADVLAELRGAGLSLDDARLWWGIRHGGLDCTARYLLDQRLAEHGLAEGLTAKLVAGCSRACELHDAGIIADDEADSWMQACRDVIALAEERGEVPLGVNNARAQVLELDAQIRWHLDRWEAAEVPAHPSYLEAIDHRNDLAWKVAGWPLAFIDQRMRLREALEAGPGFKTTPKTEVCCA